jgi:ferric-dicitrate binding protein FerR (iron transport regulator)
VDKTLPLYEAALIKLEALKPPSSDRQAVQAWLAADRRVEQATRDLGVAAQRRDFPAVNAAASRAELAGSQGRQAAAGLGLHVCGTIATGR